MKHGELSLTEFNKNFIAMTAFVLLLLLVWPTNCREGTSSEGRER